MNKAFAEHVTSTAFFLSISRKQITYLQHLRDYPYGVNGYVIRLFDEGFDSTFRTFGALEKKGLIERVSLDTDTTLGYWRLTSAGTLTCALLEEAGLIPSAEAALHRSA